MSPILAFFTKFDYLFGRAFNFTISGKEKYESSIGGISTLSTLILCLFAVWFYGRELWEKEEPTFLRFPKIDKNATMEAPSSHFVAYDLRQLRGLDFKERIRFAYFETRYLVYKRIADKRTKIQDTYEPILPCNNTALNKSRYKNSDEFNNAMVNKDVNLNDKLGRSYCVDFKDKVFGENSTYTGYFLIYLSKCNKKKVEDVYNVTCANETEFASKFKDNYFTMSMFDEDTLIDPLNNTHPVSHSWRYRMWRFHLSQSFWINEDYKRVEFSSDEAFLWEDAWNNHTAMEQGSQVTQTFPVEKDLLLRHRFWTYSKKIVYKREYTTVSMVLAEVGGIFGIVIQFFTVLCGILVEPSYNQWILQELTNSYIEQVEDRRKTNINVRQSLSFKKRKPSVGTQNYMELVNRVGLSKIDVDSEPKESNKGSSDEKESNDEKDKNKRVDNRSTSKSKKTESNQNISNVKNNQDRSNIPIFENDKPSHTVNALKSSKTIFNVSNQSTKSTKKIKAEFSYCHILKHLYLVPCIKTKSSYTKIRYEVIDRANEYINQKSDVLNLFKHYDEFEIIKKLVLDGNIQMFMHNNRRDKEIVTKFRISKKGKEDDEIIFVNPSEGGLVSKFEDIKAIDYLKSKNKYKLKKKNDRILYENMADDMISQIEDED